MVPPNLTKSEKPPAEGQRGKGRGKQGKVTNIIQKRRVRLGLEERCLNKKRNNIDRIMAGEAWSTGRRGGGARRTDNLVMTFSRRQKLLRGS